MQEKSAFADRRDAGPTGQLIESAEHLPGTVREVTRLEKITPVHTRIAEGGRKSLSPIVQGAGCIDKWIVRAAAVREWWASPAPYQ